MFTKCRLAEVVRLTAVVALLLGGVTVGPAHAAITSLSVSDAKVSGGVAVITATVTVDADTTGVVGAVNLKQPQRGGLLAYGWGTFSGNNLPAGVPVSFTVTVYPEPFGPNFQAGPADFDAVVSTGGESGQSLRTLGRVILKKAR